MSGNEEKEGTLDGPALCSGSSGNDENVGGPPISANDVLQKVQSTEHVVISSAVEVVADHVTTRRRTAPFLSVVRMHAVQVQVGSLIRALCSDKKDRVDAAVVFGVVGDLGVF